MEQVVVEVSDKAKARLLVELLSSMDFVESVTTSHQKSARKQMSKPVDFFSLAGIWADREVDIDSIRRKAWPRHYR